MRPLTFVKGQRVRVFVPMVGWCVGKIRGKAEAKDCWIVAYRSKIGHGKATLHANYFAAAETGTPT